MKNARLCGDPDLSCGIEHQHIEGGRRSIRRGNVRNSSPNRGVHNASGIATRSPTSMFNEPACRCGTLAQVRQRSCSITLRDGPHVAKLKEEFDVTRSELQGAEHDLDSSKQEQNAIIDESLSVNGEHQSISKELRASKDKLQSLKEELAALNAQIQEMLKRQCTAYNDLQGALRGKFASMGRSTRPVLLFSVAR